jgi:hypothetical protein
MVTWLLLQRGDTSFIVQIKAGWLVCVHTDKSNKVVVVTYTYLEDAIAGVVTCFVLLAPTVQ